jgi:GT2 family glycosyltransferase
MPEPQVSLILNTYQMPGHLRRVLTSVARQTALDQLEIIVADDGSTDSTRQVVQDFSQMLGRPIGFVTHRHEEFHLTRCRNEGARIATAPYFLFLDGDCILPPDHVEQYLRARRQGYVHFGYCCRLERELSERITEPAIVAGDFVKWTPRAELRKLAKMHIKALFYQWIGHPTKPALKGGNIGIWRADYERINGFDENFRAWGCEDDDLSYRVRAAGLRVASILGRTRTYHLWHPPASTKPALKWSEGPNVAYLKRRGRLTCCMNGLHKRQLSDLQVRAIASPPHEAAAHSFVRKLLGQVALDSDRPELEVLYYPAAVPFSPTADCRVLVTSDDRQVPRHLLEQADLVLPPCPQQARERLAQHLSISLSPLPAFNALDKAAA